MKKLKANNYPQASKEIKSMDESLVGKLQEEINHDDRKHYHAVMVKIEDRPGQAKNKVSFFVQQYNERAFEKAKKNVAFLGFTKIIVLHDPTQLEDEEEEVKQPLHVVQKTEAEIRKELQAEFDEKLKTKMEEALKGQSENNDQKEDQGNGSDKGSENPTPQDFVKDMTIDAMKEFAKTNEIDVTGLKKADEFKAALISFLTPTQE